MNRPDITGDFLYTAPASQPAPEFRAALRALSTPPPANTFGQNPLGLSAATRARIASWRAGHNAYLAGAPRPTERMAAAAWDSAQRAGSMRW